MRRTRCCYLIHMDTESPEGVERRELGYSSKLSRAIEQANDALAAKINEMAPMAGIRDLSVSAWREILDDGRGAKATIMTRSASAGEILRRVTITRIRLDKVAM